MENMVEVENNLKLLEAEMSVLDKMEVHVIQKENRRMELWLQDVTDKRLEAQELKNVFKDEKKKGFPAKSFNIRVQLSYRVIKTLDEVKVLIRKGKLSANSIDNIMRELVFEKPSRYSYADIVKFTSNFAERIGSGGFGDVYRGKISETLEIAAKVLKVNDAAAASEKMFAAEVRTMGKTYHRNLIKLYGYCLEGANKVLVYEYMKNGSLDTILYNRPRSIEWAKLYAIAIEIGKALSYLHDGCTFQIIHHDVKAANVLLDDEYSAKVTDFGLANLMDKNQTHQTLTKAQGTCGYAAPEIWTKSSPVTYKCDVYGFGMLLLEIFGNRRIFEGYSYSPEKVWDIFEQNRLDWSFVAYDIPEKDRMKAKVLFMVSLWCIQHTPGTRPSMGTVVTVLEKEIIVNSPPDPFYKSNPLKYIMQPEVTHSDFFTSRVDIQQKLDGIKREKFKELFETFQINCPPGGESAVILYTSSMGGLRITMTDCKDVLSLLESHQIPMTKRDLWTNPEYVEELRELLKKMDIPGVQVPVLFVKGRFIGGAKVVMELEEEGRLTTLFHGLSS